MITDDALSSMTPAERAELVARVAALAGPDLFSDRERVERRRFVHLLTACCLLMIPWIAVLAGRLPRRYTAAHWTLTWVGFDIALGGCLAVTAWTLLAGALDATDSDGDSQRGLGRLPLHPLPRRPR